MNDSEVNGKATGGSNPGERFVCSHCGWIYRPEAGDPEHGIAPGTPFDDLPDDWTCPRCGKGIEYFDPLKKAGN
jgi:rubredoxin